MKRSREQEAHDRSIPMAALALGVILAGSAWAAELLEERPVYGAFYDRYEPSFYTRIGPRSDDARRVHPHLRSPVL